MRQTFAMCRKVVWESALVVALLAFWYLWKRYGSAPYYVSTPSQVWDSVGSELGAGGIVGNVLPSVEEVVLGFVIGSGAGVVLGVALGLFRRTARAVSPLLEFLRALPPPAMLPLALVLLGATHGMSVAVIVFGVVWPVLLSTRDGVEALEPIMMEMTTVYGLSWVRKLRHVVLPGASPEIVSGMRTGVSLAVALMVVSEMAGSVSGMGHFALLAERTFALGNMWAGTLLLGVLGYLANLAFNIVERRLLFWQRARASAASV